MLNYSTHNLSGNGTILNTDVYSLDKLLSTTSSHAGIIDPNSNYLIYDKGVNHISLNNNDNIINKIYGLFNINTDYNSTDAAKTAVTYINSKNIDIETYSGALEESFQSPSLPLIAGFSLPFFYYGLRKTFKSLLEKDKKNFKKGAAISTVTGIPSIMFLNTLNNYYKKAKSMDLITKVSGLKGLYYNLGIFSLSNAFYNLFIGIKDINQHRKNIRDGSGDVGLNKKGYAELFLSASEFVGGGLMTYSSNLSWITLSSSVLSTQGAVVGSMLGGIGIGIIALGLAVKLGHYLYTKHKSKKMHIKGCVYDIILMP
ncbi:MAG: hypothetical protein WC393_04620 [Candidatus Nanoarchaeia archaeon]|jgi:hypothetical protein